MNEKLKAKKQEKATAKSLSGKATIASGALEFQKGDVRSDKFLVECKTTAKNKYSLKGSVWLKIKKEARRDGLRNPIMCIELNNQDSLKRRIYAVGLLSLVAEHPSYKKRFYTQLNKVKEGVDSFIIHDNMAYSVIPTFLNGKSQTFFVLPWDYFVSLVEEDAEQKLGVF